MSYGLKYIMQWASQNANANDYRIELYQKDYSGEATEKKMGFAPSLVMDNAGNGIMGTSLRFSIQADTDGELNDLYTTDSKMYKVLLYRNEAVVWNGYMLQELYSEEYIAPPYDVDVTATDQLALLKDEIYNPLGRVSLLRIIDNALSATQLDLGYAIQSSIKPEVQDSGTFLDYITVDDRGFADKTAYEILEGVLLTLNMTICQQYNRWYLIRRNDVNAPIYIYGNDLGYLGQEEPVAAQIGQMYVNRIYPIGNLMLTKQAAKKGAKFNFTPILPLSMLNDPNTVGKEKWSYNADYIRSYPAVEVNYRGGYIKAKVDAFTLKSTKLMVKDYALWQMLEVEASEQALKLEVAYLGLVTATNSAFLPDPSVTVRLSVQIKVESDDQTYYLTQQGWSEEDAEDIVFTGNWLRNSVAAVANKDNYNTASIEFPGFPISGKFTISFRNDSTIAAGHRPEENRVDLAVSNVYVTMPEIQGYNSNVLVNPNAAQMGPEQMLLFSDAYQVANESALNYNYILYPSGDVVSEWELAGEKYESFYQAMIQDISNSIGNVLNRFSGVISGEGLLSAVYLEKFSSSVMRLEKGIYDLVQEELSGEWIEVPANAVEVGEYEVLTNDGQRVSVGSATDSKVPTGNFASAASFEQLTKIVKILDSIIGLDEDDEAYVKPKSDGSARNFYSLGEVSSGGKNGEGGEGEGGGTGITSLYDIPEIAVTVAALADGQSLVYDATSGKWVNRLVQSGGSGVDMDYVWAALAGATEEKINASHIPDLSDVYLPLTGGYMHGNVYFDAGKGIKASNNSATIQIGMYQNRAIYLQGPALYYSPASGTDYHIWHEGNLPDTTWIKNSGNIKATDTYLHHAGYGYNADGWGATGPAIAFGASNGYTMLMQQGANSYDVKVSYKTPDGAIRDWKTIAFTDEPSFAKYINGFNGDANTISDGFIGGKLYGAANFPYNYYSFISAGYGNYKLQFNGYNNNLQFRCGSESGLEDKAWRVVAFTDSNVASATKLQTARKIWGNSFDGTGGIDGNLVLNNHISIRAKLADGSTSYDLLYLSPGNNFQIGYGAAIVGKLKTYLHGYGIDFRSKGSESVTMSLLTNGHVLIGSTTDTADYIFRVGGRGYFHSAIDVGNSAAIRVKDNYGNAINAISMDGLNQLLIGAGTFSYGYPTYLYGHSIGFRLTHGIQPLTISSKGIATFTKMSHHNEGIKIGEATLVWDAENQCLVVDKDFAGLGEISSGGISSVIGSGSVVEEDIVFNGNVAFNGSVSLNRRLILNSGLQVGNPAQENPSGMDVYGTIWAFSAIKLQNTLANVEDKRWATMQFHNEGYLEFDCPIHCVSLTQTSDITLKQIIEDVCLQTEVIANAPLFKFTWKNSTDKEAHIGTSAQYWAKHTPELASIFNGIYGLDYSTLGVLMGKSNASEIEQLKKEVKELKNEVTRLKGGNYAV